MLNHDENRFLSELQKLLTGGYGHVPQVLSNFAVTKTVMNIATQPVQVALVSKQANPYFTSSQVLSDVFNVKGPFRGLSAAFARSFFRDVGFKSLLMTESQSIAKCHLSNITGQEPAKAWINIYAGAFSGIIDTIFGSPLDNFKTRVASSPKGTVSFSRIVFGQTLKEMWQGNQPVTLTQSPCAIFKSFYRGAEVMLIKNCSTMVTFFSANDYAEHKLKECYDKHHIPWYAKVASALSTGIAVATVSVPTDALKTLIQKEGSTVKDSRALAAAQEVIAAHGWRALGTGFWLKAFMVVTGYAAKAATKNFIDSCGLNSGDTYTSGKKWQEKANNNNNKVDSVNTEASNAR